MTRLRVDMTRCDAYGYCAELLPELLRVDEWGYPVILPPGLAVDSDLDHARDAVRSCPRKALFLEKEKAPD